jgi:hypothetical protein
MSRLESRLLLGAFGALGGTLIVDGLTSLRIVLGLAILWGVAFLGGRLAGRWETERRLGEQIAKSIGQLKHEPSPVEWINDRIEVSNFALDKAAEIAREAGR